MSRSFRKTPKIGVSTAESEKGDKTMSHRRNRRAAKIALNAGREIETDHRRSGGRMFAKDGKRWVPNSEITERPAIMRK